MFVSTFGAVILASFLACCVTTLGIYIITKHESWGNQNAVYFMSFAAGVLISVSFMHIIPTSFGMNATAPIYLLVGFMGMYVLNRFLSGFHSFIDGIIYAVTFNVSILTGMLAAIGMVLHEFPEGVVTFLLLQRAGFSRKRSAVYAFLAAAVSTPFGTLVSFPFVSKIARPALGMLLAISAGALVYVGASHLLPAVEKENKKYTLISLAAGIFIAILIVTAKG